MRALVIKDEQLAANDEEIQRQLAAKDEENKKQLAVKRRRNPQTTRDMCLILGFQNIKDTLFKKVKKAYKTSLYAVCAKSPRLSPVTKIGLWTNEINGQPCI